MALSLSATTSAGSGNGANIKPRYLLLPHQDTNIQLRHRLTSCCSAAATPFRRFFSKPGSAPR
jgi:hypothetical protein